MDKLPEYVIKKLEEVAQRLEVDYETIEKEYLDEFNSDFIQKDEQFKDDDTRHKWCIGSFASYRISRPKLTPHDIIPIGVDSIRKGSKGVSYTSLFVLDEKGKLKRISLNGNICFKVKKINFWNLYKRVALRTFQSSEEFGADERTNFEDPEVLDIEPSQLIDKLKIPKVKLSDLNDEHKRERCLSKRDSTNYVIKTDWRCIHGFIQYESRTEFDEGEYGEGGKYTIADAMTANVSITEDGQINENTFNCRCSPTIMSFPPKSECYFLGPISTFLSKKTNREICSMDCYCILPIIVYKGGA